MSTINPYDGIVKRLDGHYEVFVAIQDGTEFMGSFASKQAACQTWAAGHSLLNNKRCKPELAPIFEEVMEVSTTLKQTI